MTLQKLHTYQKVALSIIIIAIFFFGRNILVFSIRHSELNRQDILFSKVNKSLDEDHDSAEVQKYLDIITNMQYDFDNQPYGQMMFDFRHWSRAGFYPNNYGFFDKKGN